MAQDQAVIMYISEKELFTDAGKKQSKKSATRRTPGITRESLRHLRFRHDVKEICALVGFNAA
jgi:hypothetical protein